MAVSGPAVCHGFVVAVLCLRTLHHFFIAGLHGCRLVLAAGRTRSEGARAGLWLADDTRTADRLISRNWGHDSLFVRLADSSSPAVSDFLRWATAGSSSHRGTNCFCRSHDPLDHSKY